ncbi:MAG: polysaccharide deacetylase family protein [Tannerella sp.]|nr:polysaccharide deacetylase family protein [Tannerella sp.]
MTELIRYLIRFLLGDHVPEEVAAQAGYTSDEALFTQYRVVMIPSGFFDGEAFGRAGSLPSLPLRQVEGTPLLFGEPLVNRVGERLLVRADLLAGAFFLLSRYEEIVRRDVRDVHGRFPGRESLPFRAGFIHRPLVDEYGRLLRRWLRQTGVSVQEPPQRIRHLHLTHDVDAPFACRTWRNVARGVAEGKNLRTLLRIKFGALENDPFYTFPWLLCEDGQVRTAFGEERCDIDLFFKAGGYGEKADKPCYNLRGKDIRRLYSLVQDSRAKAGLHVSYRAGKNPARVAAEKERLQQAFSREICASRHHFLAAREPEDMAVLEQAGITDDFTTGYADVAGFRLGTSRPVRRIDAVNRRLSALTLHPLTMMDSTLSESKYMGMNFEKALDYAVRLTEQVRLFNGELTLLWHNTSVVEGEGYHKMLYAALLKKIMLDMHT